MPAACVQINAVHLFCRNAQSYVCRLMEVSVMVHYSHSWLVLSCSGMQSFMYMSQ